MTDSEKIDTRPDDEKKVDEEVSNNAVKEPPENEATDTCVSRQPAAFLPITTQNVICFGKLYFLEGISYGQFVGFLPLVLTNFYGIDVAKASFIRIIFLPWLLKPLFAKLLPTPSRQTVTKAWISLVLTSALWLLVLKFGTHSIDPKSTVGEGASTNPSNITNVPEVKMCCRKISSPLISASSQTSANSSKSGEDDTSDGGWDNNDTTYYLVLFYGLSIQLCTAIFDLAVDFIQITTLRTRSQLGWVKTLETGLYKIGSMLAGPVLLAITSNISTSILFLTSCYLVLGFIALFVLKLPNSPDDLPESSEALNVGASEQSTSPEPSPAFKAPKLMKSLYHTKFFFVYLMCYKMFQGAFQILIPIWMLKNACIDLKQTNLVSGIIPSITSLMGTVLGGGIPGMIARRSKKLKEQQRGPFMQVIGDIWFWLLFTMLSFSVISVAVVGRIEHTYTDLFATKAITNETHQCLGDSVLNGDLDNVESSLTWSFGFMFIAISFIGGILTPLTFTEMTAKAQDNVPLRYANEYLSWMSTFEIVGKYVFGLGCGTIASHWGYYITFCIATVLQLITTICYCLSKFDRAAS